MIFYNTWFSVAFLILISGFLWYKTQYIYQDAAFAYVSVAMLPFWGIMEVLRLVLGSIGNLNEKIPALVAFCAITCFPQLPLMLIFFAFLQEYKFFLEIVVSIAMAVFLIVEFICAVFAMKTMNKAQMTKFYLESFLEAGDAEEGKKSR